MGAYLMMFAAWGIGLPLPVLNLVAAVIYHFVNRKNSRFVAFHSFQSSLSQVPVTIVNLLLVGWLVRNLVRATEFTRNFYAYLVFMIAVNLLYVGFSLVAMVRAKRGSFFYMPLFGRVSYNRYYGPEAVSFEKSVPPNRPPEGF